MSEIKDGGPAFPTAAGSAEDGDKTVIYTATDHGMSLRDWFAGQAMLGIVTGTNTNPLRATVLVRDADEHGVGLAESTAAMAFAVADAMLAERSKP